MVTARFIPEGSNPKLPKTSPELPIFLNSPGFSPIFDGPEVVINVSFANSVDLSNVAYDGVTTALRINKNIHAPMFCITDVSDIASGDLSRSSKIE